MYERFTDRARKAIILANQEAQRLGHEYIGAEHILLGLIKEGSGVGANALKNLDVDLGRVRREVERIVAGAPNKVIASKLPDAPSLSKVMEYAILESRDLKHNYVGTEHLLLGMLREGETVATQVLVSLGLQREVVRKEVLTLLGHETPNVSAPELSKSLHLVPTLVAVDIGNSGIKLGQFARHGESGPKPTELLPEPMATLELPIAHDTGLFDRQLLVAWCRTKLSVDTHWLIGTVHRGAGDLLIKTLNDWAQQSSFDWPIRRLTYQDIPLPIRVDEPTLTGIDRLLAAVAANRLRAPDRAAIVVDLGTAITVDLVEADGAFAGGAILPGIGMASRALADQTDALPHIVLEHTETPPSPLGKTTKGCIEAGLYWGAVGAVSELIAQLSRNLPAQPDIFITGGAGQLVAGSLDKMPHVRYVPHLVLAGIALLDGATPSESAG